MEEFLVERIKLFQIRKLTNYLISCYKALRGGPIRERLGRYRNHLRR